MPTQYTNKSNARRAARKALGNTAREGQDFVIEEHGTGLVWREMEQPAKAEKAPAAKGKLFTVICGEDESAPFNKTRAREAAKKLAKETGSVVTVHSYPEGELVETFDPQAKKPVKTKSGKASARTTGDDKDSMATRCIELASRDEGVTAKELNELTKWTGAPWKWFFSNHKGTGWCDRRGLAFEARKREPEDGKGRAVTTYHVLQKAETAA